MSCTTILVGRNATYDGSTFIARNDDSASGHFTPKKFTVVRPDEQPREYTSVISHVKIPLPENPQRYTAMPNAVKGKGIWAAGGANESNVAMTATETITSNERVLGADPLVEYSAATDSEPEKTGGIGEEDIVVITLPYIHTAREGVVRLGKLLEQYGTYEMNGIAFSDVNEIWWLETIGGHHWMARRVPDDAYVVMPNQLGIDDFDLHDAFGEQKNNLCSADLAYFIETNHLNPAIGETDSSGTKINTPAGRINARDAFGSHDDADHVYNTPRAWFMERYFNPHTSVWDGPDAEYKPGSDTIPWCRIPEKKITVEDVKYVLSSHFQGTPYDPYATYGDLSQRGAFRSIGINRNDFMGMFQIRPAAPKNCRIVEWIAFSSNVFNALVPFYTNCTTTPAYLSNTTEKVSTENFYWTNRIIAALADAHYGKCLAHIERYQQAVQSQGHALINLYDKQLAAERDDVKRTALCEKANEKIAAMLKKESQTVLNNVLFESSCLMKNAYARSDA
ncbi:MAG: C69 family dipeptidase [Treponema sp.]|jgi:dipeptidase|nr:C69 family dipeptidase [Treponema sp.]